MVRKAMLSRICSFSSEDPNHPAVNILNLDRFRKWKCKEPGEQEAFVIIQFDKLEKIISVDVGNESSAFIEVSVGRSGGTAQEFKVIQNQTAFMTVAESKAETNSNRVKLFASTLVKAVAAEKWDLVKIICIQPFNRQIKYGISFIEVVVEPAPTDKIKIGKFNLRSVPHLDDTDDSYVVPITPGSFFAKLNQTATGNDVSLVGSKSLNAVKPSLAATIRQSSAPPISSVTTPAISSSTNEILVAVKASHVVNPDTTGTNLSNINNPSNPVSPKSALTKLLPTTATAVATSRKPALSILSNPSRLHLNSSPQSISPQSSNFKGSSTTKSNNDTPPRSSPQVTPSRTTSKSISRSPLTAVSPKRQKMNKANKLQKKPFNKLFEDVVFVISGIENPQRSALRQKAVQMGAKCKPEWNATCTHLICAFVNTPKFQQVKSTGVGKIVTKNWIEDSFRKKCRFPWRRYCLDRNDKGEESEVEILAAELSENSSSDDDDEIKAIDSEENEIVIDKNKRRRNDLSTPQNDMEDNEDDVSLDGESPPLPIASRRKMVFISSSSSSSSEDDDDIFDADTEIDEPFEEIPSSNDFQSSMNA